MAKYNFGWNKDKEDVRDLKFSLPKLETPKSIYLAHDYKLPPPYDQGELGSCTANAVAFLVHFNLLNKNVDIASNAFRPSRLFIYYYERVIENTVDLDSGAYLRDGIKAVANYGAPSEDLWDYDIKKFSTLPSERAHRYGLKFKALKYEKIDNTNKSLLINALMQGFPICFGLYVFTSFLSHEVEMTGIVPLPTGTDQVEGGHAMVIVGYREKDDSFVVRNSWGQSWGQGGYCRIPASYLTNSYYASDFWTITRIE